MVRWVAASAEGAPHCAMSVRWCRQAGEAPYRATVPLDAEWGSPRVGVPVGKRTTAPWTRGQMRGPAWLERRARLRGRSRPRRPGRPARRER